MGIPRFYRFISEQFPAVSGRTSFKQGFSLPNAPQTKVDNLYLDANGILHNCAHDVYFGKPGKPRLSRGPSRSLGRPQRSFASPSEQHVALREKASVDCGGGLGNAKRSLRSESEGFTRTPHKEPTVKPTPTQLEHKLFQSISSYMDQLLKFVKPTKLFYIAIDGPAPLAKQAQQRQRRYKAADEKTDEDLATFDSTAITPGTNFMYKLGKYLCFYIRKMISTDPAWKDITIIFSGANVAGEGEHKIVQYIREQKDSENLVHCMYGLDADLFMLSLSTHCPKFYLLREDQFNTVWNDTLFYKVDIGLLRKELFNYWGSLGGEEKRLIDDFIFVCFLVGNDFLHALPCCHDLIESINFIMDLRKEALGSSYITGNGTAFNLNNLTVLLTHLAATETHAISAQYCHQNFPNITLNSSLNDLQHPDQGINLERYRELYYKKAGVDHKDQHAVWLYCKQYLQGLEWVQYYYHSVPKNWQWYFPYHYSPLVIDIVDYLTNASSGSRLTRVSNKYLKPILPFQQLLCVVPPRSKLLLPLYLRPLYKGSLCKYYPAKYKIDLEGKTREWEGIAILPFIDLDCVITAYDRTEKRATEKGTRTKFVRNKLGKATQFRYSYTDPKYNYNSDYGRIQECPVATRML